ncbi:MAG: CCA tRNA nucleotidyltransferase [Candidatus Nanohaloarchaeota archaeon QJJ-5]|nr:CCA tRNA nucleotidyltransferase [Candidatus Nanohaloarchaeota archaeon QJJ-5]
MVTDEVLERYWPTETEVQQAHQQFEQIQTYIENEFDREARLMGSLAKRTFIAGDKDLDIFVLFPTDIDDATLKDEGLDIGTAVFDAFDGKAHIEYAEHPYTKGQIDDFEVEIVPAYRIEEGEPIQSSVDRTPLHTNWVNETLSADEKQEVVKLKAFLKGQGLYGSSLRRHGFSGYLCEILIAHYGTMEALFEDAVQNWGQRTMIDVQSHHETLPDRLEQRFENDALIVIDPVDPDRNVAAVLSDENYARFIYRAWQYQQDPSVGMFETTDPVIDTDAIREELHARNDAVVIDMERPDVVDDIIYPQTRKLLDRLTDELERHGFALFDHGFKITDTYIRLIVDPQVETLPDRIKHTGPTVFHNSEHLENFTQKYDQVWVEDDHLTTIVDRDYTDIMTFLTDWQNGDLQQQGVPNHLQEPFADASIGTVLEHDEDSWLRFLMRFLHLR